MDGRGVGGWGGTRVEGYAHRYGPSLPVEESRCPPDNIPNVRGEGVRTKRFTVNRHRVLSFPSFTVPPPAPGPPVLRPPPNPPRPRPVDRFSAQMSLSNNFRWTDPGVHSPWTPSSVGTTSRVGRTRSGTGRDPKSHEETRFRYFQGRDD